MTRHTIRYGVLLCGVLTVSVLAGCGKSWSPACKSTATLTSPFTDLNLPVGDGRVCESDAKKARLEFQGGDKDKWRSSIEQAVTGAGYTKDKCPSYCTYAKGPQRLQVIVGDINAKWTTVSIIASTGRETADGTGGADTKPPNATATTDKKSPPDKGMAAVTNDVDTIQECRTYFAKLSACKPAKGGVSRQEEANIKKKELQEKLDKGSRADIVKRTCETFDKMLKC